MTLFTAYGILNSAKK